MKILSQKTINNITIDNVKLIWVESGRRVNIKNNKEYYEDYYQILSKNINKHINWNQFDPLIKILNQFTKQQLLDFYRDLFNLTVKYKIEINC